MSNNKKYKGAFEEAILLEVDVDSCFKVGE